LAPTTGQLSLLLASIAVLAVGGVVAQRRGAERQAGSGDARERIGEACRWIGIALGVGVIAWHSADRGSWYPLEDNFDALVWLGTMLAALAGYLRFRRAPRGFDWLVMPVAVLLLVGAVAVGLWAPREYHVRSLWHWVHRVSAYGGAIAFAVAGAAGMLWLVAAARLRAKRPPAGESFGSLETLERFTLLPATLGFALLSVGLVTGLARALDADATALGDRWLTSPKVLLALGAWGVYALVLHAPLNPAFRGRRSAVLSIVGFVLMIGVIIAVQFMPPSS
jgi:ABC-type uncharacterized transport system permease subunit